MTVGTLLMVCGFTLLIGGSVWHWLRSQQTRRDALVVGGALVYTGTTLTVTSTDLTGSGGAALGAIGFVAALAFALAIMTTDHR